MMYKLLTWIAGLLLLPCLLLGCSDPVVTSYSPATTPDQSARVSLLSSEADQLPPELQQELEAAEGRILDPIQFTGSVNKLPFLGRERGVWIVRSGGQSIRTWVTGQTDVLINSVSVGDTIKVTGFTITPTFIVAQLIESGTGDCQTGQDTDGDRLDNCVETDTGVYISPNNTGTSPTDPDTDGDRIRDGDEVLGTTQGLNLPALGANPLRKDMFFEYDWFNDSLECGFHSHRPTTAVINRLNQAFNTAPLPNPDGSNGIKLHHDYGQGGPFTGGNQITSGSANIAGGVNGSTFQSIKLANFNPNRRGYFYYVLLPHRYNSDSGSSGQAELPGNDSIVSLYCFGSVNNVSNTIMHEVGHNLGLRHGGFENCNYKPSYNSVMNYAFQFPGIDGFDCDALGDGILDYSSGARLTLNENSLREPQGICGTQGIDWNFDGDQTDQFFAFDVNGTFYDDYNSAAGCGATFSNALSDYDDWGNIIFTGLNDPFDGAVLQEIITEEIAPPEAP